MPELDLEAYINSEGEEENNNEAEDKLEEIPAPAANNCATAPDSSELKDNISTSTLKKSKLSRKQNTRLKWSDEEKKAALSHFREYLKKNKSPPGKILCIECIDRNPILSRKTWKQIKYFIYNYLQKLNQNV